MSFSSVVGMIRSIGVPSPQTSGGTTWTFGSRSHGGGASQEITTPAGDTTYVATFVAAATLTFVAEAGARVEEQNPRAVAAGTWFEFDVTSLIPGNGSYSFVIASAATDGVTVHSRNHSDPDLRPVLVVTAAP